MILEYLIFLGLGCITGVIAGLLGVGGGTIVVPTMIYFLTAYGAESDLIMKMALGTSFATIVVTSLSSVVAHNKKGSVMWRLVFFMGIGAAIGVGLGGAIVSKLSNTTLQVIFCIFLAYTITNMIFTASKPEAAEPAQLGPGPYTGMGALIGFVASFVGIGGGVLTVPILSKVGHKMKNAIGSSSALGAILAFFGALAAIANGWGESNLPDGSFGYVYLPAFIGLSLSSIVFAPLGAKLVYILPVKRIRQIFAIFLTIILINFLYKMYTG